MFKHASPYGLVLAFGLLGPLTSLAQPAKKEAPEQPSLLKIAPVLLTAGDDELQKLLKVRYNKAIDVVNSSLAGAVSGRQLSSFVVEDCKLLLHAGLELTNDPKAKIKHFEQYLELIDQLEKREEAKAAAGMANRRDVSVIGYYRADAEVQLLRAKRAAEAAAKPAK